MSLTDLLRAHRAAVLGRWLTKSLASYQPEAAAFLARERDPFANPAGHALRTGTEAILDGLIMDRPPPELLPALQDMLRLRAVQDLPPSRALGFVLDLKSLARDLVVEHPTPECSAAELTEFDARVDQLALLAFDAYVANRERLHQVHVNDIKRRVSGLMRRMGLDLDAPESRPDVPEAALRRSAEEERP